MPRVEHTCAHHPVCPSAYTHKSAPALVESTITRWPPRVLVSSCPLFPASCPREEFLMSLGSRTQTRGRHENVRARDPAPRSRAWLAPAHITSLCFFCRTRYRAVHLARAVVNRLEAEKEARRIEQARRMPAARGAARGSACAAACALMRTSTPVYTCWVASCNVVEQTPSLVVRLGSLLKVVWTTLPQETERRVEEEARRPSLIPSLCAHLARAGIEWRR